MNSNMAECVAQLLKSEVAHDKANPVQVGATSLVFHVLGDVIFRGWRFIYSENDGMRGLSAQLWPIGRGSTEKDWHFLGQVSAAIGMPLDESERLILQTDMRESNPNGVLRWAWKDDKAPERVKAPRRDVLEARLIDDLNTKVKTALLTADQLHGEKKRDAYREVCLVEQAIAALTQPDETEGRISRQGAVRAALRSGDPKFAICLADFYMMGDLDEYVRLEIERLKTEAERLTLPGPT